MRLPAATLPAAAAQLVIGDEQRPIPGSPGGRLHGRGPWWNRPSARSGIRHRVASAGLAGNRPGRRWSRNLSIATPCKRARTASRHNRRLCLSIRPRLLLATSSADKIREYPPDSRRPVAKLLTRRPRACSLEVEETGGTFRENATLKARAVLGRQPGRLPGRGLRVRSRRAGWRAGRTVGALGRATTTSGRTGWCWSLVSGRVGLARRCRYVCSVAFVDPNGRIHQAAGTLTGTGRPDARPASDGFGYDPIFELPRLKRTLAEI